MAPPLLGLVETHGLAVHVFFSSAISTCSFNPVGLSPEDPLDK